MTVYSRTIPFRDFFPLQSRQPLISRIDIELTERCNYNCIHCYINLPGKDRKAQKRELSSVAIENILAEAAALGCLAVRFTGGEPLLREDFCTIYLAARQLGLQVLLQTNASLITSELATLFSRVPPLVPIGITVYGITAPTYEGVTRTPGSFASAQIGIQLLLDNNVPFNIKGVLLPPTRQKLDEFTSWVKIFPRMDPRPPITLFFHLRARRDSEERNRQIKKLRLSHDQIFSFIATNPSQYLEASVEFCSKFMGPPKNHLFSCGAGVGGGCVDAYGQFQPCMLLRHPDTVYDLLKGSLHEALTTFFPTIRKISPHNLDYLRRCAGCFLTSLCEQCPARSWIEHGNLDTPVEYYCEVAHAQARYLGLLNINEFAWEVNNWQDRLDYLRMKACLSRRRM